MYVYPHAAPTVPARVRGEYGMRGKNKPPPGGAEFSA
jgi:hypothetical protein